MVALGEHRLAALVRYFVELRPASHDSHMVTARSLIRLDDERCRVQKRGQRSRFRCDECGGRWHSGRLQDSDRDDLVMQRRGNGIRVDDGGAHFMQRSGQTEGETARLSQHVEIVLDPERREVDEALHRMDHVDVDIRLLERLHDRRHIAPAVPRIARQQESDA